MTAIVVPAPSRAENHEISAQKALLLSEKSDLSDASDTLDVDIDRDPFLGKRLTDASYSGPTELTDQLQRPSWVLFQQPAHRTMPSDA